MANQKRWIQKAISHPGALTKKAKAAGQSPMAFARSHQHTKGTTGKQARLAITLGKMSHSKTKSARTKSSRGSARKQRTRK